MLFRKLELDWRYAVGELFIVVAGVMIALAADGWLKDKSDHALEREYLVALAADLASDTAELSTNIALAARRAELGQDVLLAMAGDTVLDPAYLAVAVERAMYFAYPAYSRSTISDLMSTGNLRLLRDQALKRKLSEYYRSIDQMEQWSGNWRKIQMDFEYYLPEVLDLEHRQSLVSSGAPMDGLASAYVQLPWARDFEVTEREGEEILVRLRSHPEIRSRLEGMVRIQAMQFSYLTGVRSRAEETLGIVEAATR